ncbi:MAG: hypothetical protein QGE95_13760 [Arenicellales bacterium]|nr:hypothetical protein [Arenicellales bacterium]
MPVTIKNKTFSYWNRRCVHMRVRSAFTFAALAAVVIFIASPPTVRAEDSRSSEELLAALNSDGKLIVATMKKKIPDPKLYEICVSGPGNVRAKVIAVTTYLASARKLKGEPWAAGNATTPYFEARCEELAEAELEKDLAD